MYNLIIKGTPRDAILAANGYGLPLSEIRDAGGDCQAKVPASDANARKCSHWFNRDGHVAPFPKGSLLLY